MPLYFNILTVKSTTTILINKSNNKIPAKSVGGKKNLKDAETHSMIKRAYRIPIRLRDAEHTPQAAGKALGLPKCLKSPGRGRTRAVKGPNIQIIPWKQSQNKTTTDLSSFAQALSFMPLPENKRQFQDGSSHI